jgi:ABC-2 type transport system permease protein
MMQDAPAARGGTVFDIGYQRYTGTREGRGRARRAIYKDGVRTALGLGRGWRAKVLPWSFLIVLSVIGLIMALVAGAAERIIGAGSAEQLNLPRHADFYGIASIPIFLFAAVVGPALLTRDRRDRTIHLYLVRPVTGTDYIVSRYAAFFTVMLAAAWAPQILLLLGLALGDPEPGAYLGAHWIDIPQFLLAGVVMAAYTTTLALFTASFTTRHAYAAVFLAGTFLITAPFTMALASELEGPVAQWLSMFALGNIPIHVNDRIFGELSAITEVAPARELPTWILVGWYFLWTLVPGAFLWGRYRRMTP